MISKRIAGRTDGKSSAVASLRYGEGLTPDKRTGEFLDKSHRTRFGNFGLIDDGIYAGHDKAEMSELIELAGLEMQSNCDLNTRVAPDKKIAHFVVSFNQVKPSEAVLLDTEDSILAALKLDQNHFATFLHDDNGYWHLHIFASRIDKINHLGNPLWQDQTIRDRVCREIELRHQLEIDNGLHRIVDGAIVEIPFAERIAIRGQKDKSRISDRALTIEKHSGEKSFQTWCNEMRIGDRLKHAKSWQDLHQAAAAYDCEVHQRGAGFIIRPVGEQGGIQLSKVGLKNLPAKFGSFEKPNNQPLKSEFNYSPTPTQSNSGNLYKKWREAKTAFNPNRVEESNALRESHKQIRHELREKHQLELAQIRAETKGPERLAAISIHKMEQSIALTALAERFSSERQALRDQQAERGPGNTFRDYLVKESGKGDPAALELARKYGIEVSTLVSRQREEEQLRIVARVSGLKNLSATRLRFPYQVQSSGTVVFDLGDGRAITDNATARQVQLNDLAAHSPEAVETALRFSASKFGNTLTLTGSQEFQRHAVEIVVSKGMNISFYDPQLEAYKNQLISTINTNHHKEKSYVTRTYQNQAKRIPPAKRRDRMHQMSELTLVSESQDAQMLLPQDVSHSLAEPNEGRGDDSGLRRTGSGRTGEAGLIPATEWVAEWSKANGKQLVEPLKGDGQVAFKVAYLDEENLVLDLGRSVAIYPRPQDLNLPVGSFVTVDKSMSINLLQQKSRTAKER
jgi:hypothetical protein